MNLKVNKGILRGLHYQLAPVAQRKLVRVIHGSVFDVVVDIRRGSPPFGQHVLVELNSTNKRQLLVPRGFTHAFVVLEDDTVFAYKVDNYYSPEYDRGISFKDAKINIDWILNDENLKLSEKDQKQPNLNETDDLFNKDYIESNDINVIINTAAYTAVDKEEEPDLADKINPIETNAYHTPASRPHYSLINKTKIKGTSNIYIPYGKDSLEIC